MKGNTKHYIFISTISAYANDKNAWADESDPTHAAARRVSIRTPCTVEPESAADTTARSRRISEKEVEKHYPGDEHDHPSRADRRSARHVPIDSPTGRTASTRAAKCSRPGDGNDPVQFIDSRDLAEWTIRMAENRTLGTFNATGPVKPLTMAEMLYGIKGVTTAGAQFTWVPADFSREQKVRAGGDMPVWVPDGPNNVAFSRRSIAKAIAAGLTFRPLAVTAKDTLDWNKTRPAEELRGARRRASRGISAEREAEVLAAWKAKQAATK